MSQPFSLKETKEGTEALSVTEYRTRMNETFIFEGPSGLTYELRRPSPAVMEMMTIEASDFGVSEDSKENIKSMREISHKYLPAIIKTPKVVMKGESDNARQPDALYVDELAYNDRMAIITWAMGTSDVLPDEEEVKLDQDFPEDTLRTTSSESSGDMVN